MKKICWMSLGLSQNEGREQLQAKRKKKSLVRSDFYLKCRIYIGYEGNLQGQRNREGVDYGNLELTLLIVGNEKLPVQIWKYHDEILEN